MNYRHCHRCQAELPPTEDGTLVFCAHCGAPQVELSEELKEQVEAQATAAGDAAAATAAQGSSASPSRAPNVWHAALQSVAIVAAIEAGFSLLSLAFGPVLFLAWLWAVISPVVVIVLLHGRSPQTPMSGGFGARLGLVTGLALAFVLGLVYTVGFVAARQMHALSEFDSVMATRIAQVDTQMDAQIKAQAAAQPGVTPVLPAHMLSIPEFRAGMLLASFALLGVALVVLTTAGGAFAGFVRGRQARA